MTIAKKTWDYFLVEKLEAIVIFKSHKTRVEKETGAFIKRLRTDRREEFTSQNFTHFCDENDIQRQLTATYTPQQNGVTERKKITLL
jgi:transposase InsO family protein